MVTKIETTPGTVEWIIDELQYLACNPDDVDINKLANMIHFEVSQIIRQKTHKGINYLLDTLGTANTPKSPPAPDTFDHSFDPRYNAED